MSERPTMYVSIDRPETLTRLLSLLFQSVLYECLYSGVFGIADAYDAGRTMLALPEHNKPTFYDRGYEGSVMASVCYSASRIL